MEFLWLGEINRSPNVVVIGDPAELSDQGDEGLLRDAKSSCIFHKEEDLNKYSECIDRCVDLFEVRGVRQR
jgi:hypothetical protein